MKRAVIMAPFALVMLTGVPALANPGLPGNSDVGTGPVPLVTIESGESQSDAGAATPEGAAVLATLESPGFKRLKPPAEGSKKRILVQIDPAAQAATLASMPAWPEPKRPGDAAPAAVPAGATPGVNTGIPAVRPGTYDWYWSLVSPAIGDRNGRFSVALDSLNKGPDGQKVPVPRLQAMQDIATAHFAEILTATAGTEVSPALVVAVISVESGGRSDAVSHAGAVGLMQLISATGDRFGVADRTDPGDNIRGGVAYLDWLMKKFGGDPVLVLAAYNAGENAVTGNGGVPPFAETRDYVPKVLAAWTVARSLCLTPPDLVSDGCVFAARGQAL